MRDVPAGLAAHLAEPATTLCRCWRLVRRDGTVMGFTDHDRDLVFGPPDFAAATFAAGTGLEPAEAGAELGFATGGGDVSGALSSAGITEADLVAGAYDDARVETWLVNWAAPAERMRLGVATIGEVRRADRAFVAELRDPLHRFDEPRGLVYRRACSADLGDARCRVDLAAPAYGADATVAAAAGGLTLTSGGLGAFASGWFDGGRLVWTGGANGGGAVEVKSHRLDAGVARLDLWQRMPAAIAAGDTFRVTAGCDKQLATCTAKFANTANFRGFPHMPGNDFVVAPIRGGAAVFDGGSLFR